MAKTEKKIRLGMIGTGRIANRFIEAAELVPQVQLACVYNPRIESARRFAEAHGDVGYTADREELYQKSDAIYIASLHETHTAYVREALDRGKHVLCEKPLSFSKKEAKALFSLAEKKHLVFREALKSAYAPGFMQLMQDAKDGRIGEIVDVEAAFTKLTPTCFREITDIRYGGSTMELGSYVILPILRLLGTDYQNVQIQTVEAKNGVDIFSKIFVTYPGKMGLGKTGLMVKSEGELIISGTKGYIVAKAPWWLTKEYEFRYEDPNCRETVRTEFTGSGLQYELQAFSDAVLGCENEMTKATADEMKKFSIAEAEIMEDFLQQREKRQAAKDRTAKAKTAGDGMPIWAHRGYCIRYPENTLLAFEEAAKISGVTGIELDVQLTRDRQVVVFHDETLDRVMNASGRLETYTKNELQQMTFRHVEEEEADAGIDREMAIRMHQVWIPTLDEVLTAMEPYCRKNGLKINIELKTGVIHYENIEEMTLAIVKAHHLENYIVYSSFWAESIKKIRQLSKEAETGILAEKLSDCIRLAKEADAGALHPWIGGMDCAVPEDMKDMPVRAWNSQEPFYRDGRVHKDEKLEQYKIFGVTELFTNDPQTYCTRQTHDRI